MSPMPKGYRYYTEPPLDRFMKKIHENSNTGCWIWSAGRNSDGYGAFQIDGKSVGAHRWLYIQTNGEIPKGLELDHVYCQNRACVNPDHLEPVTHAVNVRRGKLSDINKVKTHCPQGHPYAGDNLYMTKTESGGQRRSCKICMLAASRRHRAKKKLEPKNRG